MPDGFIIQQDGVVTVHAFSDSSDGAVDTWKQAVIDLVEATPPDGLFRLLVDVSPSNVSFTRHARQAAMAWLRE